MSNSDHETLRDCTEIIKNVDIDIVAAAKMIERIEIFDKLRGLILEKDLENDIIASNILGWAYEKLSK